MLRLKYYISKFIRIFGYEVRRLSSMSSSVKEPFYHFRKLLDKPNPVIFDIGAYVGDTIKQFKSSFQNLISMLLNLLMNLSPF